MEFYHLIMRYNCVCEYTERIVPIHGKENANNKWKFYKAYLEEDEDIDIISMRLCLLIPREDGSFEESLKKHYA